LVVKVNKARKPKSLTKVLIEKTIRHTATEIIKSKLVVKVNKARKPKSLTKALIEKTMRHTATEIIVAKPDVNGRTPQGFAEKLLIEAKETLPKLTMNRINYAIKNLRKQLKSGVLNVTGSNISSLTDDNNLAHFMTVIVMMKVSIPNLPLNLVITLFF
jgi:hypothetical protein